MFAASSAAVKMGSDTLEKLFGQSLKCRCVSVTHRSFSWVIHEHAAKLKQPVVRDEFTFEVSLAANATITHGSNVSVQDTLKI